MLDSINQRNNRVKHYQKPDFLGNDPFKKGGSIFLCNCSISCGIVYGLPHLRELRFFGPFSKPSNLRKGPY